MIMEFFISLLSTLGINGILLFFVKRYFDKRDKDIEKEKESKSDLIKKVNVGLETLRILSYLRMSEELERLLDKGFATPSERKIIDEMYNNYKEHGWNGDMDSRLEKVYKLRTDHAESR